MNEVETPNLRSWQTDNNRIKQLQLTQSYEKMQEYCEQFKNRWTQYFIQARQVLQTLRTL